MVVFQDHVIYKYVQGYPWKDYQSHWYCYERDNRFTKSGALRPLKVHLDSINLYMISRHNDTISYSRYILCHNHRESYKLSWKEGAKSLWLVLSLIIVNCNYECLSGSPCRGSQASVLGFEPMYHWFIVSINPSHTYMYRGMWYYSTVQVNFL